MLYDYNTETVDGKDTSVVLYMRTGSSGNFTKATGLTKLESGKEYVIASQAEDNQVKILYLSAGHEDAAFTKADVKTVTLDNGAIKSSDVEDRSIYYLDQFKNEQTTRDILRNKGAQSWLLLEETGGNFLKGGSGKEWTSKMYIKEGRLIGQVQWDSGNPSRYIVFNGITFTSQEDYAEDGEKVTLIKDTQNITNVPLSDVKFSLNILKTDTESKPLSGATFQIKKDDPSTGTAVKFSKKGEVYILDSSGSANLTTNPTGKLSTTGLTAGTYYIVETVAPPGYEIAAPKKVVLDANAQLATNITIIDGAEEDEEYVLPETGGIGLPLFYLLGLTLVAIGLVNIFNSKKKEG